MRILVVVLLSLLPLVSTAETAPTEETPPDPAQVAAVEAILAGFSATCRVHAGAFLMFVSDASVKFNTGEYQDGLELFDRYVEGTLLQGMNSDECDLDDVIKLRELRDSVQSLEYSLICMTRYQDAMTFMKESRRALQQDPITIERLQTAIQYAQFTAEDLDDLTTSEFCAVLPKSVHISLVSARDEAADIAIDLQEMLEQ
jgi:hypothetical protein